MVEWSICRVEENFSILAWQTRHRKIKQDVRHADTIEAIVSLATSVKEDTTRVPSLFLFNKFSSHQKFLRLAAYILDF